MGKLLSTENKIPRKPWTVANGKLNEWLNDFVATTPLTKSSLFIAWSAVGEPCDSIFVSMSEEIGDNWHPSCSEGVKILAERINMLPELLRDAFDGHYAHLTAARQAEPQSEG